MKKIIVFIFALIIVFPFKNVYADDSDYSDWSIEPMYYSQEEEAIQYGVKEPIWTDWYLKPQTDFDYYYEQVKDFGGTLYITSSGEKNYQVNDADAKTIYTWDFGEIVNITDFYIDVDCWESPGSNNNYIAPEMRIYVDDEPEPVASVEEKDFAHISDNWEGQLNVQGKTARLEMSNCNGNGRNRTTIVYSYLRTTLIKYRYVIGWKEPTGWRFDEPYTTQGLPYPQIAVERKVYRYPLNPVIDVKDSVLFENDTYEYIEDLATALDFDDTEIIQYNKIAKDDPKKYLRAEKFEYIKADENGNDKVLGFEDNPSNFKQDEYHADKLRVTYVAHGDKRSVSKTVTFIIIKEGVLYDLKIYNRYIDEFNYLALNEESKWKQGKRKEKLTDAFKWLERK